MSELSSHAWYLITSFGGVGLTLPLAIVIALWLTFSYSWRITASWLLLLGSAIGIVTVTKIVFLGWGIGIRKLDFTGISGHAMLSAAVYPVAFFLILLSTRRSLQIAGIIAGLAGGAAIGLSRIALEAHSPSESTIGFVVGAITASIFIRYIQYHHTQPRRLLSSSILIISFTILAFILHDVRVPTHKWITYIALKVSNHKRPFVRAKWKVTNKQRTSITASVSQTKIYDLLVNHTLHSNRYNYKS